VIGVQATAKTITPTPYLLRTWRHGCIYRGTRTLMIDDVLCLPCDEFLRRLRPGVTALTKRPGRVAFDVFGLEPVDDQGKSKKSKRAGGFA